MTKKAKCVECGEEYSCKRLQLGYKTCLDCGGISAIREIVRKSKCIAPAFNKGSYTYVHSKQDAKDIGR
jgi:hypothetical protein|tara:strand:+ start:1027 stop:1233 length:207 start_codon:yes stop_codon:yes gene_type:complete